MIISRDQLKEMILFVKKFPAFLYKPMVHYSVHKSPPMGPVLSQIKSVNTPCTLFSRSTLTLDSYRLDNQGSIIEEGRGFFL